MLVIVFQKYEDDDFHAALLKNQRVKRSTVEYYLCLSTTSSQCNSSCETQCETKHSLGHTFTQDGTCYAVQGTGSCPSGDTACSSGYKCSCAIQETTCDK